MRGRTQTAAKRWQFCVTPSDAVAIRTLMASFEVACEADVVRFCLYSQSLRVNRLPGDRRAQRIALTCRELSRRIRQATRNPSDERLESFGIMRRKSLWMRPEDFKRAALIQAALGFASLSEAVRFCIRKEAEEQSAAPADGW